MLRVLVIRRNISKSFVLYEHYKLDEKGRNFARPLFRADHIVNDRYSYNTLYNTNIYAIRKNVFFLP